MKAEKAGKTKAAATPPAAPTAIVRALGQDAPVADMPAPLQVYLQNTLGEFNTIAGDADALWHAAQRGLQMETAGKILAGRALAELRQQLPPREFAAGLAERQVARSSAYDAIAAFQLFADLPDFESVRALGQMGVTKARALSHWRPEEYNAFATGQEVRGLKLDAALEMSTRELDEHQRRWQQDHDLDLKKRDAEIAQLRNQVDTLTNENTRLVRNGAGIQAEEDLPHFARAIRQEAMAITEQMSFGIDSLQATLDEHLFTHGKLAPEHFRFKPITAGTAYFAIAGVFGRLHQMLQQLETAYPDEMGRLSLDHQLSPVECKRFLEARAQLLASAKQDTKARENDRENTKPGKRGAKRK